MPDIRLTDQAIDEQAVLESVRTNAAGAAVLFVGTTREFTAGRRTVTLHYEAYREMAEAELHKLATEAGKRFDLCHCAVVHRLGEVPLGETSIVIAVSAPHRADAFEAGRWLIDTIKQTVPIWKREQYDDGSNHWIHPDPNSTF